MAAIRLIAFVFCAAFIAALFDVPFGQLLGVPVSLGLMLAIALAVVLNLQLWAAKLAGTLVFVIGMMVAYDLMRLKLRMFLAGTNPVWIVVGVAIAGCVLVVAKVIALTADKRPQTRKVAITRRAPVVQPDPDEDTDEVPDAAAPVEVELIEDDQREPDDLALFGGGRRGRA